MSLKQQVCGSGRGGSGLPVFCVWKNYEHCEKSKNMVIYGIIWVWFCFLRFLYACESCGDHDKPLRSTCILHLRGALECAVCLDEWRDKLSQTRLFLQGRITPQIMVYTII